MVKEILETVTGETLEQTSQQEQGDEEERDKEEETQDDDPQDKDDKIVSILNVFTMNETHRYERTRNKIFAAINAMHMKNVRRGALQTQES